jgi:hypothetical protein
MADFKKAIALDPKSKDARDKFNACKKQKSRIDFENAIFIEHKPASQTVNLNVILPGFLLVFNFFSQTVTTELS